MIWVCLNNIYDKELISVYKNGLFMEDYFLSYFDQILNIITSSLNQVYNSKYFSTQANEQTLTSKLKIEDISAIGKTEEEKLECAFVEGMKAVLACIGLYQKSIKEMLFKKE